MINLMFLIVMSGGVSLFGADANDSNRSEVRINEFLQKYEANLPQEYKLVAVARTLHTNPEAFVLVSKEQESCGKLKVEVGQPDSLMTPEVISFCCASTKGNGQYLGATIEAELAFRLFHWRCFGETIKHLLIASYPNLQTGVFDDKEWTHEDIKNKNPEIPQEAWLEILKCMAP